MMIKSTDRLRLSKRPIVVDLFAGAGGMSLAFEQAGFDIAAAVEIDPIHCAVHHYNFPDTSTICADVSDISGVDIRALSNIGDSDIDVLCGGAPCQGFSLIGRRALDDPRNLLVSHFVRLTRELKPKYFVFENVKGLTLGRQRQFLDELVREMQFFGYDILSPWKVLNAANFGVPQNRERLFLIGARRGLKLPVYPESAARNTVGDAILDLPNADNFPELLEGDVVKASFETASIYSRRLRGLMNDPLDFGYPRLFNSELLTCSGRTEHNEISRQRFDRTLNGCVEPISRFLKLDASGFCNTLRAGTDSARGAFTSPRPIHPNFPRVITVREAARLHSYPDWFRFHSTKWHGFREIGNSVPPMLGRAVAGEICRTLDYTPCKPANGIQLSSEYLLKLNMATAARLFSVSSKVIGQRLRKPVLSEFEAGFQMRLCEPEAIYG